MNLKEAFRFQNKLQSLSDELTLILCNPSNITSTKTTYLRKKVMAEAEDETVVDESTCDYREHIPELVELFMHLLHEREKLSAAIHRAKLALPIDMDGEVGLNTKRQKARDTLIRMDEVRNGEVKLSNGGTGYRFNAEGNQVSYKCDIRRVTTITFDRNAVRNNIKHLNRQIDETSTEIDRCLINSDVDYSAEFDVNDSLMSIFERFMEKSAG